MLTAGIIAGLAGAALQGLGAYKAGQQGKKNQTLLSQMADENKSEYMSEYYRGALDNPGSKAYLKRLDQSVRDSTKATENTAAATGATQENVLAAKQANNEVMSNAIGGLVQQEDMRKEGIKQNYFQRKNALTQAQMGMNAQIGQNWMNAASNIAGAAGNLASVYMLSGKKLF